MTDSGSKGVYVEAFPAVYYEEEGRVVFIKVRRSSYSGEFVVEMSGSDRGGEPEVRASLTAPELLDLSDALRHLASIP